MNFTTFLVLDWTRQCGKIHDPGVMDLTPSFIGGGGQEIRVLFNWDTRVMILGPIEYKESHKIELELLPLSKVMLIFYSAVPYLEYGRSKVCGCRIDKSVHVFFC